MNYKISPHGNKIIKTNPSVLEVVKKSIAEKKIRFKQYYSKRKNEFAP